MVSIQSIKQKLYNNLKTKGLSLNSISSYTFFQLANQISNLPGKTYSTTTISYENNTFNDTILGKLNRNKQLLINLRICLVNNLSKRNISCSTSESISSLVDKVLNIQTTVNTSTTISAGSYNISDLGNTNITATVKDNDGNIVKEGSVRFYVGGVLKSTVNLNSSGQASFNFSNSNGTYSVYAQFIGTNSYYSSSSSNISISVYYQTYGTSLSISSNTSSITVGDSVTLYANLGMSSYSIAFYFDGNYIGSANTNGGTASFTHYPGTGNHSYSASFGGSGRYTSSSSGSVGVSVSKRNSSMSLNPSSNGMIWGTTITLSANIGISGQTVTFYQDGTNIGTATTNSSGVATKSVTVNSVSTVSFSANYGGNSEYNGCSASCSATWTKRSVNMGISFVVGGTSTISLNDSTGAACSGCEVSVYYQNASGGNTSTYWATTNTSGKCTFGNSLTSAVYWKMVANFGGSDKYNGASGSATHNP